MIELGRTFLGRSRTLLKGRHAAIGKWVILLGMLYLAIRVVEWPEVVSDLARVSPAARAGFLGLILLSKLLYAWRWRLICVNGLGLRNVSGRFLLRTNLLGEFVGIAVPSILGGDAVRVLKLSARVGQVARVTASVAADRLLGVFSIALLAIALLPKLGLSASRLPAGGVWGGLVVAFVGLGVVTLWIRQGRWAPLPRVLGTLEMSLSVLGFSFILSVAGHLAFAAGHYLLFRAVGAVSFLPIVAVTLTAQLARSVPVSLLGVGLSEGSLVALAGLVGIEPETALVVVVVGLCGRYVFALVGLLVELGSDGRGFLHAVARRKPADPEVLR